MAAAFALPRATVFPVEGIDIRLEPGPHPYETAHAGHIAENWASEVAANPALFNGTVVLFSALGLRAGRLAGRCHAIGFATFLHWRRFRAAGEAEHCFAHAMPVTADGALLAVRMGMHTANPGRVYFAAGSFEPQDFRAARLDVAFNMAREVGEETGIDLGAARAEPGWHVWSQGGVTAIFRRYRLAAGAAEAERAVARFVAAEARPEIDGPVLLRRPEDLPPEAGTHMRPLVDWHFSHGT